MNNLVYVAAWYIAGRGNSLNRALAALFPRLNIKERRMEKIRSHYSKENIHTREEAKYAHYRSTLQYYTSGLPTNIDWVFLTSKGQSHLITYDTSFYIANGKMSLLSMIHHCCPINT
jgi:hypothetical protein